MTDLTSNFCTPEQPRVYLLCGLTGSGKTSFAQLLERDGCVRLSIDEAMHSRYGRQYIDYPTADYRWLHQRVREELDAQMVRLVRSRQSVVLDYGLDFWRREGRDAHKRLVEVSGGRWVLVYFKADPELLLRRLAARRHRGDANAFDVSDELLAAFIAEFEEPVGESELVLVQS